MENKLIKINSMETLENGFISVNADFELGHLEFWTNQCEIDRLIAGGNMDRLTEDRYEWSYYNSISRNWTICFFCISWPD